MNLRSIVVFPIALDFQVKGTRPRRPHPQVCRDHRNGSQLTPELRRWQCIASPWEKCSCSVNKKILRDARESAIHLLRVRQGPLWITGAMANTGQKENIRFPKQVCVKRVYRIITSSWYSMVCNAQGPMLGIGQLDDDHTLYRRLLCYAL